MRKQVLLDKRDYKQFRLILKKNVLGPHIFDSDISDDLLRLRQWDNRWAAGKRA